MKERDEARAAVDQLVGDVHALNAGNVEDAKTIGEARALIAMVVRAVDSGAVALWNENDLKPLRAFLAQKNVQPSVWNGLPMRAPPTFDERGIPSPCSVCGRRYCDHPWDDS